MQKVLRFILLTRQKLTERFNANLNFSWELKIIGKLAAISGKLLLHVKSYKFEFNLLRFKSLWNSHHQWINQKICLRCSILHVYGISSSKKCFCWLQRRYESAVLHLRYFFWNVSGKNSKTSCLKKELIAKYLPDYFHCRQLWSSFRFLLKTEEFHYSQRECWKTPGVPKEKSWKLKRNSANFPALLF